MLDAQIEIEQSKEIHLLSQLLPENLNNCKFVNALLGQNKVTGVIRSVEILLTTLLQESWLQALVLTNPACEDFESVSFEEVIEISRQYMLT